MGKIITFLIVISIFSPLFGTTKESTNREYAIKIGIYKKEQNAKNAKNRFKNSTITIDKLGNKYHVYITNFNSKKEAKKRLKSIKKEVKDAYITLRKLPSLAKASIVNNRSNPKSIKTKDREKIYSNPTAFIDNKPKKRVIKTLNQTFKKEPGLTLKEAILKALERSNKINSAKEKVIQAKRKVDEKRAGYKPKITLYATGAHSYQHIRGSEGLEHDYINGSAELSLTQNIYSGGKVTNSVKKEIENLKAALFKFRSLVEEETINIIDSYLGIIYEKKSIEKNRENQKELQKILDIVAIKERNGASTKGDLNYIKSNIENSSSSLLKAESRYQNAISYYEYFIGSLDQNSSPIESKFNFSLDDKNITIDKMQKYNAKIQTIEAQLQAQKYDLEIKKAQFKPNIDFIINTKQKRTKSDTEPDEDRANAMISLNYNLYNGGKDKAAVLGSKSKISELRYKLIDLKESTKFNTIQMYDNIKIIKNSLVHIEKEVDANRKVTDSYWKAFKYKEQDLQALLLAQRALNRSQLDEIKERRKYLLDYFKLLAQTGELLEKTGVDEFVDLDKIK